MVIRSFKNTDPPFLAQIWNEQPRLAGLAVGLSAAHLEAHLFAKPYFNGEHFLVATEVIDNKEIPLGFLHWSFALSSSPCQIDERVAAVGMVMAEPNQMDSDVCKDLLAQAESDAAAKNAKVMLGMEAWPIAPFYHGLYGGSLPAGVLAEDTPRWQLFAANGYLPGKKYQHLKLNIRSFRQPVSRGQMQIRRQSRTESLPADDTWKCVCRFGELPRFGVALFSKSGSGSIAQVRFWEMSPMDRSQGVKLLGVESIAADSNCSADQLAFLTGDAVMHAKRLGYEELWITISQDDSRLLEATNLLGFEKFTTSTSFTKPLQEELAAAEIQTLIASVS
jgi:hypothetical protein